MKILLADDDELVVEAVRPVLAGAGHEIIHAASGQDALTLAASETPGLIVLDIGMPGVNGMEVLSRLKALPAAAQIPVIMLTAKRQRDDVMAALSLGARDYLVKPFEPPALLERIKRLIPSA